MNISFDYDGTLTDSKFRELANSLQTQGHDVYILTSRRSDNLKDVHAAAWRLNIPPTHVIGTDNLNKGDYIRDNNLNIDIHFDDDYFEIENINSVTNTIGVLVSIDLHPLNNIKEE